MVELTATEIRRILGWFEDAEQKSYLPADDYRLKDKLEELLTKLPAYDF